MVLNVWWQSGPSADWAPVPVAHLKKCLRDPFLGRYLQKALSDGKVSVYPGYTKEQAADGLDRFLRQHRLVSEKCYVLIEECGDHRDERT